MGELSVWAKLQQHFVAEGLQDEWARLNTLVDENAAELSDAPRDTWDATTTLVNLWGLLCGRSTEFEDALSVIRPVFHFIRDTFSDQLPPQVEFKGLLQSISDASRTPHSLAARLHGPALPPSTPDPEFESIAQYVAAYGGNSSQVITRILIANNGMAAAKGIRSIREWANANFGDGHAVEIVVMASPEDLKANAEFIKLADKYVEVPGGENYNNYANVRLITETAIREGVSAVWPGWGHASEKSALPLALAEAGILFMGPPAAPMEALGDKIAAMIVAQNAGVSVIPWSGHWVKTHSLPEDQELSAKAYEVVIKDGRVQSPTTPPQKIFRKMARSAAMLAVEARAAGHHTATFVYDPVIKKYFLVKEEKFLRVNYAKQGRVPDEIYRMATVQSLADLFADAELVGYPIMEKAAGTGGGRGMRKSSDPAMARANHPTVIYQADGSEIFVMKLAPPSSRHIEVQIVADEHGNVIPLFERECSIQRRHQKVIEEAPAVAVPEEIRIRMRLQAANLAREVGYRGMGTVEFLYDPKTREFYFLELNSRLQVEHPATEGITDLNLPAIQLAISMGVPLTKIPEIRNFFGDQEITTENAARLQPRGHMIAVRITAENTDDGFKPTSGKILELNFRSNPDVWGYFSVGSHGEVHPFADSQIGHIFAWGQTREAARRKMIFALEQLVVRGEIRTNREYVLDLLKNEDYIANQLDIDWLDKLIEQRKKAGRPEHAVAVIAGALHRAYTLSRKNIQQFAADLSRGHRPYATYMDTRYEVSFIYDGYKYDLEVDLSGEHEVTITLNGSSRTVSLYAHPDGGLLMGLQGKTYAIYAQPDPEGTRLEIDGKTAVFTQDRDPTRIVAAMPGKIVRWLVEDGASVDADQDVVVIESMKMEQKIKSLSAGKIRHIKNEGDSMAVGEPLAALEIADHTAIKIVAVYTQPFDDFVETGTQDMARLTKAAQFVGEPHFIYRDAAAFMQNTLKGFHDADEVFEEALKVNMRRFFSTLVDPTRFTLEFLEAIEDIRGRISDGLERKLRKIHTVHLNGTETAIVGEGESLPAFPARDVLEVLSEEAERIDHLAKSDPSLSPEDRSTGKASKEKQAFETLVGSLRRLVESYDRTMEEHAAAVINGILAEYLRVEQVYDTAENDAFESRNLKAMKDKMGSWEPVYDFARSHHNHRYKMQLVLALLEQISGLEKIDFYRDMLEKLSALKKEEYAHVARKAKVTLAERTIRTSFEQREDLSARLLDVMNTEPASPRRQGLIMGLVDQPEAIFDVLIPLMQDPQLRLLAVEIYVRRAYRYYSKNLASIGVTSSGGLLSATWEYGYRDSTKAGKRTGIMGVFSNHAQLERDFERFMRMPRTGLQTGGDLQNTLTLILLNNEWGLSDIQSLVAQLERFIAGHKFSLLAMGLSRVTFALRNNESYPVYITLRYRQDLGAYKEDLGTRGIEPPLAYQLEHRKLDHFAIVPFRTGFNGVHLYYAEGRGGLEKLRLVEATGDRVPIKAANAAVDRRFFVRSVVRKATVKSGFQGRLLVKGRGRVSVYISEVDQAFEHALQVLELAELNPTYSKDKKTKWNQIFIHVLPDVTITPEMIRQIYHRLAQVHADRLKKLRVLNVEVKINVKDSVAGEVHSLRFIATNPTGHFLQVEGYEEVLQVDGRVLLTTLAEFEDSATMANHDVREPYAELSQIQMKQVLALSKGTTYVYDLPSLLERAQQLLWADSPTSTTGDFVPRILQEKCELVLDASGLQLVESSRTPGQNTIGMVAWKLTLKTPEYPTGREVVLISNDITHKNGSFAEEEDRLFQLASQYARERGIPRVYIAANSGARFGLDTTLMEAFQVAFKNPDDPTKGFDYLYLDAAQYAKLGTFVRAEDVSQGAGFTVHKLTTIIGRAKALGVENLRYSGLIAREASQSYEDIFTLTYVMGLNVGIGAYISRLAVRIIQKNGTSIILTGKDALNVLLGGVELYVSNEQLGGVEVMIPNGVSNRAVKDDLGAMQEILAWMSYVPRKQGDPVPVLNGLDSDPTRPVSFKPASRDERYDPRSLIEGTADLQPKVDEASGTAVLDKETGKPVLEPTGAWLYGMFDRGSFHEVNAQWGRTVVAGHARLGGIPMGVIAVETRDVTKIIPADPSNREGSETSQVQAGRVWYPDSASKTVQAISDFNKEGLPLMVLANWKGFSGGTRDMVDEVLKFGSFIVDNLRKYNHPVYIYIPPFGEIRGGAWVVIDPLINPDWMEMYAAAEARGGVLEASGIVGFKFRDHEELKTKMHQLDPMLQQLDALLNKEGVPQNKKEILQQIKEREAQLLPVYRQIALHFADLHDTPERMKAVGVIEDIVPWESSRQIFYWKVKRRLAEKQLRNKITAVAADLNFAAQTELINKWIFEDHATVPDIFKQDGTLAAWFESTNFDARIAEVKHDYARRQVAELFAGAPDGVVQGLVEALALGRAQPSEAVLESLRRALESPKTPEGGGGAGGGDVKALAESTVDRRPSTGLEHGPSAIDHGTSTMDRGPLVVVDRRVSLIVGVRSVAPSDTLVDGGAALFDGNAALDLGARVIAEPEVVVNPRPVLRLVESDAADDVVGADPSVRPDEVQDTSNAFTIGVNSTIGGFNPIMGGVATRSVAHGSVMRLVSR